MIGVSGTAELNRLSRQWLSILLPLSPSAPCILTVSYVVWDKVPGEPLDGDEFWKLDLESRQAIRNKFREAYPYIPLISTPSKIIYDKATGDMHFSGFQYAGRTDTNEEWHDKYYVLFDLAKPSEKPDWDKDTTGWTW